MALLAVILLSHQIVFLLPYIYHILVYIHNIIHIFYLQVLLIHLTYSVVVVLKQIPIVNSPRIYKFGYNCAANQQEYTEQQDRLYVHHSLRVKNQQLNEDFLQNLSFHEYKL